MLLLLHKLLDVCEGLEADEGPEPLVLLLQHVGVLEVVLDLGAPLDARVADVAHLHRVEFVPLAPVEILVEVEDELGSDEIEEGIPNVAVVLSDERDTL